MSGFYLPTPIRQRKHEDSLAALETKGKRIQQAHPGSFIAPSVPVTEALEPPPSVLDLRPGVPAELCHGQRGTLPPRPDLPEREPEFAQWPARLRGLERRRLLARPEPGGVRLHLGRNPGDLAADQTCHRGHRPSQRDFPDRIPDHERLRMWV